MMGLAVVVVRLTLSISSTCTSTKLTGHESLGSAVLRCTRKPHVHGRNTTGKALTRCFKISNVVTTQDGCTTHHTIKVAKKMNVAQFSFKSAYYALTSGHGETAALFMSDYEVLTPSLPSSISSVPLSQKTEQPGDHDRFVVTSPER